MATVKWQAGKHESSHNVGPVDVKKTRDSLDISVESEDYYAHHKTIRESLRNETLERLLSNLIQRMEIRFARSKRE